MPDITMCLVDDCPKAKECYRHEAKPDKWQSYARFICNNKNKWGSFYPMKGTNEADI